MALLDENGLLYVWSKIKTLVSGKVDKVSGKGLSTNDYTTAEKNKLAGIAANANNYVHPTGDGNQHVPATGTTSSGKVLKAGATAGSAAWSTLAKSDVGLSNVDNTSDANKPVSTAQQTALNGKVDKVSGKELTANDFTDAYKSKLDGIAANANNYVHPTGDGNKHVPATGTTNNGKFLMAGATAGTLTWGTPKDTTYADMTGATASAAGKHGLVPAPAVGKQTSYLRGDGTWVVPPNTTYNVATTTANGLMSKEDKTKLDGVEAGAEVNQNAFSEISIYRSPSIKAGSKEGSVTLQYETPLLIWSSENEIWFRISEASSSSDGYMSSTDKQKLDAFGAASTYALKSDITGMYKYKGSVTDASKLPTTGQKTGDVYNIESAGEYGGAGMNVAWNGTAWDPLGEIFSFTTITNAQIDAICV